MQLERKVYCHWDLVRFVKEDLLKNDDGTLMTLSVTDGAEHEIMLFLGKDDSSSQFEVRIYRCSANQKYIPHQSDHVLSFVKGKEYDTFFFENFNDAIDFLDTLSYRHEEYQMRPFKK